MLCLVDAICKDYDRLLRSWRVDDLVRYIHPEQSQVCFAAYAIGIEFFWTFKMNREFFYLFGMRTPSQKVTGAVFHLMHHHLSASGLSEISLLPNEEQIDCYDDGKEPDSGE